MNLRVALIILVGMAAMIEDLGWRRISNWTSGGAVLAGWIVNGMQKGWPGVLHSLLGTVLGFVVFLVFYLLGGMGGGDVKLMAGFGALLGDRQILPAAMLAAGSGGVMAMGFLAIRAMIRQGKKWFGVAAAETVPAIPKSAETIPYAPAITVGAWLALVSEL